MTFVVIIMVILGTENLFYLQFLSPLHLTALLDGKFCNILMIFCLFCCFMFQSIAVVMVGQSVNLTTLFPGQA